MYLDDLPDLSRARLIRASARGHAIRDGERAVAVAFVADGSLVAADTLVRFDVTRGEDPTRRLADALAVTGARGVWFYGGDVTTRRAALGLTLELHPVGSVYVRRMDAASPRSIAFREPLHRDRISIDELRREHAAAFRAPRVEVAEVGRDAIGIVFSEALDGVWTELRIALHPTYRAKGYGGALLAAAADRLEAAGRRVCAAIESNGGRERSALETAGFRLSDYYFIGTRSRT
ncbi:MAG TPA: GNAT family N-acetyltransferase [Candidatus Acidoferrum sp.]|nr:GNAT family N-acetyltransferase [Candidatus Acidoferrum sp.]